MFRYLLYIICYLLYSTFLKKNITVGHLRHQKYKNKQLETIKPINISIIDMNEFEKKKN